MKNRRSITGSVLGVVAAAGLYVGGAQAQSRQQNAGQITAQRTSLYSATVQWTGNSTYVKQVTLEVLDANGKVISQETLSRLPVVANLTVNQSAKTYGAVVYYTNGTKATVFAPVKPVQQER